jgi:hypothetical protein
MRADMAKVLVERPRPGSREGSRPSNGYKKRYQKAMAHPDGAPTRERMTAPYGWTRPFNEHLGPLRRYVEAQVGRPWDKVYAEICSHIDRGNVVQKHILTHLFDYVITRVILIDGEPCYGEGRRYGESLRDQRHWWRNRWYVCPKSGLLKRVPPPRKRPPSGTPKPPAFVRVNGELQCHYLKGQWELVTVAPLPPEVKRFHSDAVDVVLRRRVSYMTDGEARAAYGARVYATSRRPMSKRELMQYPIPIEFIRR